MNIEIEKNKLCSERQSIEIEDSVLTLIGENGCGKSSILEAIFEKYLEDDNFRTICFSSGQNELFTDVFNNHKSKNKKYLKKEENNYITSFHFNYDWIRVLILFATVLKPKGNVRNFLFSKKYIKVDEKDDLDISTRLRFRYRVRKSYTNKIHNEIKRESQPDFDFETQLLRKSHFHETLVKLTTVYRDNFDFEEEKYGTLYKTWQTLDSNKVFEIFTDKNINKIFTFWALATFSYEKNIDIEECRLYFDNNLEFKYLSDGEYQLLSVYALIDLFDDEKTIFLFDEIDSHLYYKNLEKLWGILSKEIKGKIITTTHISDSILQNKYKNIKLIHKGKVEDNLTLRELAKRVSSIVGKEKFEFQLASRAKNVILIDHEDDWTIFKKLAQKKLDEDTNLVFSKLIPFQRTSSFKDNNDTFALGKLKFVKEFKEQMNGENIQTQKIFLICDRDKFLKDSIGADLQVIIPSDFRDLRQFNGVTTYLLSWNRLEIENYLISVSMLTNNEKLTALQSQFSRIQFSVNDNLDGIADIEEYDAKYLVHPFYKPNGFSESLLDNFISFIPKEEISDDIVKMYTFLKNNIA